MTVKEIKDMGFEKFDRDTVYLTGSQKTITRTIYINGYGTYCEFYGQMIKVEDNEKFGGYHTVETY